MQAEDLAKAIFYFRKEIIENGYARFDPKVTGIIIGYGAFVNVVTDPSSYKWVEMKEHCYTFQGIPMYRTDDIDRDTFKLF